MLLAAGLEINYETVQRLFPCATEKPTLTSDEDALSMKGSKVSALHTPFHLVYQ